MKFHNDILPKYIACAPLALALERVVECRILSRQSFERPILDIGCGDGLYARMLFAEELDTGVDPDPAEIGRATRDGGYKELLQCFGNAIPKPDASYRTILSNSVLEHIPDVVPVLHEAHRLLQSGGHFYFTVPSANFERFTSINLTLETLGLHSLSMRFRRFFNRFWAHHHAYPMGEWAALAQQAGFEVLEARTYAPKRVCLLNAALTPLALPAKILKANADRWFLIPAWRSAIARPLAALLEPLLRGGERADDGGLVFVALRKP